MSEQFPAIILARGGSKGIPGKNLIPFCGRPLLAWSIIQAAAADHVAEVIVSSDDPAILDVARHYGAVPIRRPDHLASDEASSESALLHALDVLRETRGREPEAVVFLQPTSPLRAPGDIDEAVETFFRESADSLFSCAEMDDLCVWREADGALDGLTFDPWNRGRRQDRPPLYLENGSIYVFRPPLLRRTGNRLGGRIARYVMPRWQSFEIDEAQDVDLCEYHFRRHLLKEWGGPLVREMFSQVRLLVYDFDGVMTDNRALQHQDGTESVYVHRGDGWAIARLREGGWQQVILSTETNPVVRARARKLGLDIIHGCDDKMIALLDLCRSRGLEPERVAYVGNDVNDLEAMRRVGWPIAPADADSRILAIANIVTRAPGGGGVIRELWDHLND